MNWVIVAYGGYQKYGIIDLKDIGMAWKNRKVFGWSNRKACRMILVEKKSGGR